MKTNRLHQKNRGFTFVELLVMIAILCILAALLLPALQKTLLESRLVVCASNLKQQYVGLLSYTDEWNGHMPAPWVITYTTPYLNDRSTSANSDSMSMRRGIGMGALIGNGYLSSAEVVLCPDNNAISAASQTSLNNAVQTGWFDATTWTETTYRPNPMDIPYQQPVVYAGARSFWDWPNQVDYYAALGVTSRLKGNLPGGLLCRYTVGTGSYVERRLRSPRALNACAIPDFLNKTFIPHQGFVANVLFADGVLARCYSGEYPNIILGTAGINNLYRDCLNMVYPNYKAPK